MIKIFKKTNTAKKLFFLFADLLFIILAVFSAFLLRFDGKIPASYFAGNFQAAVFLLLVLCLPIFYIFKLYSFSWVYVSTTELISLAKSIILSLVLTAAALFIFRDSSSLRGFPRSVFFISYFLIFIFCGGLRFSKRIYFHLFKKENGIKKGRRTLIIGAGDAGEQILRSIFNSKGGIYSPVAFADDNPAKQGLIIHGLKVLGKINDITKIVKQNLIEQMIIALPSANYKTIRSAVEKGREAGLKDIKIIPSMAEIISGEVSIRNLREIEVEDLLGRAPVSLNTDLIKGLIVNKNILITGAAGSIGSELSRQVAKFEPAKILLLDQDETGIFNISREIEEKFPSLKIKSLVVDIQDKVKIEQIFSEFKPEIVFHAAAYKHVPLMEINSEEAVKNNIFGTKTVAETALKQGIEKFIFISTDKAVNPSSVMGATKRIGEMICQALNQKNHTKFISVRFGNVFDSRGSVIPVFKEQIKKGGPVEVTHPEMKRYFMVTSEAVLLVLQAGAIGKGGEVFVLDMGKPIKILDLAREIIKLSGFEPDKDIPIVFTKVRPGEKLFEEILTAEEGMISTQNNSIFMAKLSDIDERELNLNLEQLKKEAGSIKPSQDKIKNIFKNLVPSYKNS